MLIAIGNSGRSDDGLGWAFLDGLADLLPENWQCEYRYQLQVDDAELISRYATVYFVDADTRDHPGGFHFDSLQAKPLASLTSHQLEPSAVLYLCNEIYGKIPGAFVMGISGANFDLSIGLGARAIANLQAATGFFKERILSRYTAVL